MDYSALDIFYYFYDAVLKNAAVSYSMNISKSMMSAILLVQGIRLFSKAYKTNSTEGSLSFYELFRPLILIIVIVSYTYVMDSFDQIAKEAESEMYKKYEVQTSTKKYLLTMVRTAPGKVEAEGNSSLLGEVATNVSTIATYMEHPSLLIVNVMEAITSFIDFTIFTFVIILRFGFLFILRFLGPIVIALSIYERFSGWWVKWITAYGLLYLWIICIFLINFFAATVALGVYKILSVSGAPDPLMATSFTSTVTVLVAVKVYFYFKTKTLLYKIFS